MRAFVVAALMLVLAPLARAQAPVTTIVVNFVAGGPSDLMARLLAPELSDALGGPVVVKNSAGAAGTIGAAEVARSRPDGTTLLLSSVGAVAIQPHVRTDLPYRPGDLAPVCQVADTPVVVMVAPGSGVRTIADLLNRVREARGTFAFASPGSGSLPHVATAALARTAGVEMTHVPYRGSAEAATALLRGEVGVHADQPGTLRANGLRALAVMAEGRTPEFPEVPTLREQGLDVVYSIWSGLFARAGTPSSSLDRLEAACERALRSPAVVEGFRRLATPIVFRNQRDFAGFWQDELAKFRRVLQAAGIRSSD
jgi:tripartite-type tricarboxylate transporter receptor subunit TctC